MKKILFVIAALAIVISASHGEAMAAEKYELKIEGMGCAFCTIAVQKKFRSLDGIDNEHIDLETGVFTFTLPGDNVQTKDSISQLIDETGYVLAYFKVVREDGTVEEYELKEG